MTLQSRRKHECKRTSNAVRYSSIPFSNLLIVYAHYIMLLVIDFVPSVAREMTFRAILIAVAYHIQPSRKTAYSDCWARYSWRVNETGCSHTFTVNWICYYLRVHGSDSTDHRPSKLSLLGLGAHNKIVREVTAAVVPSGQKYVHTLPTSVSESPTRHVSIAPYLNESRLGQVAPASINTWKYLTSHAWKIKYTDFGWQFEIWVWNRKSCYLYIFLQKNPA